MLKYYMPNIIFFIAWCCAAAPVIYYYYRKNPHPRFRPSMGEMAVITIMALLAGGGGAMAIGGLFRGNLDLKELDKKPDATSGSQSGRHGAVDREKEENEKMSPRQRRMKELEE